MIDWQLQFTFDNFLRFSIHRLRYSTLFMSTTVCSSACRRYEPPIVCSNFVIFCCFQLLHVLAYIQWQPFTYTSKFLPITVVFVCLLHISSLGFALVAPYSDFFRGFVVAFQAFYSSFLRCFVVDFLYFSSSNIICYTHRYYTHMVYIYFWQLYNMYMHR